MMGETSSQTGSRITNTEEKKAEIIKQGWLKDEGPMDGWMEQRQMEVFCSATNVPLKN